MPELAEIITIRNDLIQEVLNKKIVKIESFDNFPLKPTKEHFNNYVKGYEIKKIFNIAKLLVFELSSEKYIAAHLRMSGNLLFNTLDPYVKIALTFENEEKLNFSSVRKFEMFEVWEKNQIEAYTKKNGKTIIESDVTSYEFMLKIKGKKTSIKNALLDQSLISGIGNIYANEALHLAKINPKKKTADITDAQYNSLFKSLVRVVTESVKNRGSSFNRYKDLYGEKGTQQDHFKVYRKKGLLCTQCNDSLIEYEKISGRGTFYCPTCQPFN